MCYFSSEGQRQEEFPVVREGVFVAHAGVTALPWRCAEAMKGYIEASCEKPQEFGEVLRVVKRAREEAGRWIGKSGDEVALLGPTSLGLSLFANGIEWEAGDEVLVYGDDYPANVYPWLDLRRRGVKVRYLETEVLGKLTPEVVERGLTPKTRLVALASCHFLTGWRLDVAGVSKLLKQRGVLFSLDAIQTLGAFATPAGEVDFLSADAHKWMLGPMAVGIVAVAKERFAECRPSLLGAWNVEAPDFIAQEEVRFVPTAQRYEPGVLNCAGIYGMLASLELLGEVGIGEISALILQVRDYLEEGLEERGWEFLSPGRGEAMRSGILTARPRSQDAREVFLRLEEAGVVASLRSDRSGKKWLRFSPHFYNTMEEMDRILRVL